MQTLESLRQLVVFNEWANRRMLESLKAFEGQSAKALRPLSHLLIAEKEWMTRMLHNEDSTGFDFWPASTLDECEALANDTAKAYADFVNQMTEEKLDHTATYKNSKGTEYITT